MFGLPGGCILPVYDPLLDSPIRHILVRHEQGAGHMAEGYAHVTGRPGVAMVTSGPAATNIVTPLCDAYMDSIPMVVITGQVPAAAIGTDAFQECDTIGITRSVTKHNELVTAAQDIPRAVREAFHIATTGRPGPVLLDIPKDIVDPKNPNSAMDWHWPSDDEVREGLPGYRPTMKGHPRKIREAAELILRRSARCSTSAAASSRPRPPTRCRSWPSCATSTSSPPSWPGAPSPTATRCASGMPGMHGNYTAVTSMQRADLLIALGTRFDDRVTGKVGGFAPEAKIIHADIDPAELGKVRRPDVPIVGDCRLVIEELVAVLKGLLAEGAAFPDRTAWKQTISGWQEKHPLTYKQSEPGDLLKPQFVLEQLRAQTPEGTHRRQRRRPAPDVDVAVLEVRPPLHLGELGWPRHHGLLGAGGHRRQGRPARRHGVGRRRRRLLPDDRPGAGHRRRRAHPGEGGDPQQRLPRHGPPVAGDVLRGALLRGVPVARPARLQALGRGHGLRRHAGRVARGGRVGHPEGQRDRRPPGGHRLPHRQLREGVPDGAGRATNDDIITDPALGKGSSGERCTEAHHILSVTRGEQGRGAGPRRRPVRPPGLQHLQPGRGPTEDERFSRITIVVDVESAPLEQITKQLFKLVNVVKISELDPRGGGAGAAARHRRGPPPSPRPDHRAGRRVRGPDPRRRPRAAHRLLEGHPDKLDDFEELLRPYGIVELQRTGRVALPKIDNSAARLAGAVRNA